MGLFDIFKTKWSSGDMTDDDRKKLFWYLKRKTSYTAWKRQADAFDAFALIFKKQVVEEPHAPGGVFGPMNWNTSYPDVLKAQVLYEKGLQNLRTGDRTVWLYNDRSILRDAWAIAVTWHTKIVYGGERGDLAFYGKYLEDMKAALCIVFETFSDSGYVQPRMANTPAANFWGEAMDCNLNNEGYPRNPSFGYTKRMLGSFIKYRTPLPDVPVSEKEVLIRTGEIAPVFGIYEPQVKDGCMNYLLKDVPAPPLAYAGSDARPVIWRLIWEDTRYLDGTIPAEERLYFPPEEQIAQSAQTPIADDFLSAPTNQPCSKDGSWAVMDDINAKSIFKQGDKMPQHNGRDVLWLWVSK